MFDHFSCAQVFWLICSSELKSQWVLLMANEDEGTFCNQSFIFLHCTCIPQFLMDLYVWLKKANSNRFYTYLPILCHSNFCDQRIWLGAFCYTNRLICLCDIVNYLTTFTFQVRCSVLHHFNVTLEEYDIIFTSGATGAIKLLASVFAWTPGQALFYFCKQIKLLLNLHVSWLIISWWFAFCFYSWLMILVTNHVQTIV